jgi:hypothetical protein
MRTPTCQSNSVPGLSYEKTCLVGDSVKLVQLIRMGNSYDAASIRTEILYDAANIGTTILYDASYSDGDFI